MINSITSILPLHEEANAFFHLRMWDVEIFPPTLTHTLRWFVKNGKGKFSSSDSICIWSYMWSLWLCYDDVRRKTIFSHLNVISLSALHLSIINFICPAIELVCDIQCEFTIMLHLLPKEIAHFMYDSEG